MLAARCFASRAANSLPALFPPTGTPAKPFPRTLDDLLFKEPGGGDVDLLTLTSDWYTDSSGTGDLVPNFLPDNFDCDFCKAAVACASSSACFAFLSACFFALHNMLEIKN